MTAAPPAPDSATPPRAATPWPWAAVALAPGIALSMTAVATCAIALLAVPVAFVLTRDSYVALLAVSYGPYATAQVLVSVAVAATGWGVIWRVGQGGGQRALAAIGGGALASLAGLLIAPLPLLGPLAVPWRYGPTPAMTPRLIAITALAGGVAGCAALVRRRGGALTRRAALWQACLDIASFALVLALLLGGWAAVTALLG